MNQYELYEHKKSDTVKWIIAFTLIAALLIGTVANLFINIGRQDIAKTEPTLQETEGGGSNLLASAVTASPMMYLASYAAPATADNTEAVTISATLTADSAVYDNSITWDLSFQNAGSAWASGKTVSDYVLMTVAEDMQSVTVECIEAFGEPIIVRATSNNNPDCSATCQLDYVKRLVGVSDFYINSEPTYRTSYKNYMRFDMLNTASAKYELGTGTITPELMVSYVNFELSQDFQDVISNNITPGAMQPVSVVEISPSSVSEVSGYITCEFMVGIHDLYYGGGDEDALNDAVYRAAYDAETGSGAPYMGGKPGITLIASYGDFYQTYEYTHNTSVPFERGALTLNVAVTDITLDKSKYAF